MKYILLFISLLFVATSHALPTATPPAPVLTAKAYVLFDHTSHQVMLNRNGNTHMEPAALTKLMTAYLTFGAIKKGVLAMDQILTVPDDALRNNDGESRMLLKSGQSVTVDELLHGLIVQSGNDAALTLASSISANETDFVAAMNKEAQRLGMSNTHFTNAVGISDPQHYSTANDIALLAAALVRDFPEQYPLFGLRDYTFNNVTQANRNRLLWLDPYADGLKTGHSDTAGFCLVGSAKRDQRRLISVVLGADSDSLRASESQQLLNYGFQYFDAVRLYSGNQAITQVRIWKGTEKMLNIGMRRDLFLTIPKGQLSKLKATVETRPPLLAPITSGQQIGVLKFSLDGQPYAEFPLVALDSVSLANVFSRGWDSIRLLVQKYIHW
ncbi:MAG: D-alanyl-D-alanine carboxypeptidase [Gallionella sp.]|nr:D-alanyl-D-alanine carboxypeptidase [Gallionella sp.]MDD4945671.1 D-alanyl-D-alanine carboxypeptidase [Gallionella sp.]MDD5611639.1 D-alanyl-D-alanine carboxypeptidase [Gallionella sp.]